MFNKSHMLNCMYWWLSIAGELLKISIFVKSNFSLRILYKVHFFAKAIAFNYFPPAT